MMDDKEQEQPEEKKPCRCIDYSETWKQIELWKRRTPDWEAILDSETERAR